MDKNDREGRLVDALKKIITSGIGAAEVTEELARKVISDVHFPKEIINHLLENAKGTKEEFINQLRKVIAEQISSIDFRKEWDRVLENYELDIQMKVNFKKKDDTKDQK